MRLYQPIWEQIKKDKEKSLKSKEVLYYGTVVKDIYPGLVRRVDKAVRKEKNSYETDWPMGRFYKLRSYYNPETFELRFHLVPYRVKELMGIAVGKLL